MRGECERILTLQFAVRDTGIGIAEGDRKYLFQAFSQVDASSTRRYGGTGLGLAICRQLVQKMGGQIWVESEPNQGSTFVFTAQFVEVSPPEDDPSPAATESLANSTGVTEAPSETPESLSADVSAPSTPIPVDQQLDVGEISAPPPAARATASVPAKVLVVEDTHINQKVVMNQLKLLGYKAACVNNGQEALDRLQQERFDMVLMDCQMPVLDGYQATQRLRLREKDSDRHMVVVGLTAHAMEGDREKCLNAGMDDYLAKPVTMEKLKSVLEHWMTRIESSPVHQSSALSQNGATVTSNPSISASMADSTPAKSDIYIDWDRLHEVSGDDLEFELELLDSFMDSAREYVAGAETAIIEGDLETFSRLIHQIKGASGNVGIPDMMKLAGTLNEQVKRQPTDPKVLQEAKAGVKCLDQMLDQVAAVMGSLAQELQA